MEVNKDTTNNTVYLDDTPNNGLDAAFSFEEGLAFIEQNGKHYFINEKGENAFPSLVIGEASDFSEGWSFAEVNNQNVYLDKTGEIHYGKQEIENASCFSEGLAFVKYKGASGWICIDKEFKELFSLGKCEPVFLFSEGFAVVKREIINYRPDVYWDVDETTDDEGSKELFVYDDINNGEVPVVADSESETEYAYNFVDRNGKLLLKRWCLYAGAFSEGFALVRIIKQNSESEIYSANEYNYINKEGQLLCEGNFDYAEPFSEGLGAVALSPDFGELSFTCCYINTSGERVTPKKPNYMLGSIAERLCPLYSSATSFSEGAACISYRNVDGMDGEFIDHDGNSLFSFDRECQYLLFGFKEGLAGFAEMRGFDHEVVRQYFVDKSGKEVFDDKCFDEISPFSEGFAVVKIDGKYHYINKEGKFLNIDWL